MINESYCPVAVLQRIRKNIHSTVINHSLTHSLLYPPQSSPSTPTEIINIPPRRIHTANFLPCVTLPYIFLSYLPLSIIYIYIQATQNARPCSKTPFIHPSLPPISRRRTSRVCLPAHLYCTSILTLCIHPPLLSQFLKYHKMAPPYFTFTLLYLTVPFSTQRTKRETVWFVGCVQNDPEPAFEPPPPSLFKLPHCCCFFCFCFFQIDRRLRQHAHTHTHTSL